MDQTYNQIELKRDSPAKFTHVTGRRVESALMLKQISICPAVDITEFPMLQCSFDEDTLPTLATTAAVTELQPQLLRRSLAKYNLANRQHESIISTAEGHFSKRDMTKLSAKKLKNLRPKMTSSILSHVQESPDQLTFHVENASTPKRIQRSSTPRNLLKLKKNILTSTLIEKKSIKANIDCISVIKANTKKPTGIKLTSKSTQTPAKRLKLKATSKKSAEFFSSTGISCEINLDQIGDKLATGMVAKHSKKHLRKSEWRKLKYPIKYAPNMKVKDINRLDVYSLDDMYSGSIPCSRATTQSSLRSYESQRNGLPISNSCYSCGDSLKFWII